MKIPFLVLILALIPFASFSQNQWTLQACILHAQEHNIQIRQASLQAEQSNVLLKQAKYNRLPSVSAELTDGLSFGRTLSENNRYKAQNSNAVDASLNANVPIFQGLRMANEILARNLDVKAAREDEQKIRNDVSLTIAAYFLNVLVQKELLNMAHAQRSLTDTLQLRIETLVNSGKEPVSKLYELQAQQANDLYAITTAEKNLKLALLDLAQLLEIENYAAFDVAMPEILADVSEMPIPAVVFEDAIVALPDVRAEELRLESAKKSLDVAQSGYVPSVSLNTSVSTNYYDLKGTKDDKFEAQISHNRRAYLGMTLSIPIFNRMNTKTAVAQSKLHIQEQELRTEQAKKTVYKDIQRAMLNADVAKNRYIAATNSVRANAQSHHFVEQHYASGRISFFDLQQSKTNLDKALSEQIQAKYEFIFNLKMLDFYNGRAIGLP